MKNSLYICGEIVGIDPLMTKRYQASFSLLFSLVLLNSLVMKINGNRKYFIYPGERFGMLTIIREVAKPKRNGYKERYAECRCDCGNLKTVLVSNFRKPYYKNANCGCVSSHSKHGLHGTHLFKVWDAMIDRCTRPNNKSYHNYGGRGITVCEEWKRSGNFFKWALSHGYDERLQLDRENNNGNYEPSNCRFVTHQVNSLNIRKRSDHGIYYRADKTPPYQISMCRFRIMEVAQKL
jgi:hypothetical protein